MPAENTPPEKRFADAIKSTLEWSPKLASLTEIVSDPDVVPMERLNRFMTFVYKHGDLDEHHQSQLVRVWMTHAPDACHAFVTGEDRIRVEKRVVDLEAANNEKAILINELQARLERLEEEKIRRQELDEQEARGLANTTGECARVKRRLTVVEDSGDDTDPL